MRTLSLALRNLLRNRRRSLTTLLALIVGAQAILMFGGYSRNIALGLQTDYVQRGGHLQIQREGFYLYGSGNPAAYGIADYESVMDAVKRDPRLAPMLSEVTPTLELGGIAGNFAVGVSRTALARGMVVEDQNRMRSWNDYDLPITAKPLALTGSGPDAAVVGSGVARVLQLCGALQVTKCEQPRPAAEVGGDSLAPDVANLAELENPARRSGPQTRIELLAATARGAPNVAALNVIKAEDQGVKELDDVFIALHLPQAQRLVYGGDAPRVTAITVQLRHTDQMQAAKARLEELLATQFAAQPLEVLEFQTLNPFYSQALAMLGTILGFIAVLMGAIVLFTVGNTMSMAVVERTTEIGTLRAMGLRRAGILRLFVSEGVLLGAIGALLGVVIAIALSSVLNHSGLTWTPPGRSPAPLLIRVWGESSLIAGTVVGLMLVAVLSAWWPARRAARQTIVDALRHV